MKLSKLRIELAELWNPDLLFLDGYDNCIVGIVERFGQPPIVCYNKTKILERLITDGCTPEEAEEYFEFNQLGASVGTSTPCFITFL